MAHRCLRGRRLPILGLLLSTVLGGATFAQSSVIVVDQAFGPGADFSLLGPALVAAQDGDTVLIRKGSYTYSLYVNGKSLSIVADDGASVLVPQIWVENLSAGQCVSIRGVKTAGLASQASCLLNDNAGAVIVEDCEILPLGVATFPTGGLTVSNCASVSLVRCIVAAPLGKPPLAVTAEIEGSSVHMWGCTVDGGDGAASSTIGGAGGTAVELSTGFLLASGCTFVGGDGGDGTVAGPPCAAGGNGGDGLRLTGLAPVAYLHGTKIAGGQGGKAADPTSCRDGADGRDQDVQTGGVKTLPGTPAGFSVSSVVAEGQPILETYTAPPGVAAFLLVSTTHGAGLFSLPLAGSLAVGPTPVHVVGRGSVPAGGTLTVQTSTPELGRGVESVVLFEQSVVLDFVAGTAMLGPISVCTLIDSSI